MSLIGPLPLSEDEIARAVRYADDLARKNSEALSFIPTPRIEQYARDGQLWIATENDEPCGFLIFGNGWPQTRIYQACIQYDARRREHGMALVSTLADKARAMGCTDIRLWCADDLDANEFWRAAGFEYCAARRGGRRRGRQHNLWALRLVDLPLILQRKIGQAA
jgi:ribosomal protein S18 acetylase RimI-like enzyme